MELFNMLLAGLAKLTPIGLAGLIALLIFGVFKMLLSKNSPLIQIKDNHLEHIQQSLEVLVEQGKKQIEHLDAIKVDIAVLKDRSPRRKGNL